MGQSQFSSEYRKTSTGLNMPHDAPVGTEGKEADVPTGANAERIDPGDSSDSSSIPGSHA